MFSRQFSVIMQSLLALAATNALVLFGFERFEALAQAPGAATVPAVSASRLIIAFLLSSAVLFILVRRLRSRIVFEAIFSLSILVGIWAFFELYVASNIALASALVIIAVRYLVPRAIVQNVLMMVGIAGIGVFLGSSVRWQSMLAVLTILAIYDVIAVYGTHHMVKMFKGLLEKGVIFAFIIPERPRWLVSRLREVRPGEGFFFLGSGDIALPAVFVASAAREGLAFGVGAAVGSLVGLFFTDLLFSWGRKRPMPALPPIVVGTIAGFFAVMFFVR